MGWPSGGGRYGVVSTALNRKDSTAPFASSGAFGLVLHWPLCGPDLYLGTYPAPETFTAPGTWVQANLPVLWLPTFADAEPVLAELLKDGDLCLVMGAGGVDALARRLVSG